MSSCIRGQYVLIDQTSQVALYSSFVTRHSSFEMRLNRSFFTQNSRIVAQQLLGKILVRDLDGVRLAGRIVETEAYCDFWEPDLACHGSKNGGKPTPRTKVMFGPAGYSYVYFNYGIHWLFNVVTGQPGVPGAVLIRALEPLSDDQGEATMNALRLGKRRTEWTNGPAKLTQALAIDKNLNGKNLCAPKSVIWIEDAPLLDVSLLSAGPRIGLGKTPEPWLSMPWRFWVTGNGYVSKR